MKAALRKLLCLSVVTLLPTLTNCGPNTDSSNSMTIAQTAKAIEFIEIIMLADFILLDSSGNLSCLSGTAINYPLFESSHTEFENCESKDGKIFNGTAGGSIDISDQSFFAYSDLMLTNSSNNKVFSGMLLEGSTLYTSDGSIAYDYTADIDNEIYTMSGTLQLLSDKHQGDVIITVGTKELICSFVDFDEINSTTADVEAACGM